MDPIFGPIIGGAVSALGSFFGNQNTVSAQQQMAQQNIQQQLNFARNALSWKAQDATDAERATGINRLALLGVPTNSFSNVVGATDPGAGVREAGQDIGRAIAAASSINERQQQLEQQLVQAKIDNVNADTVRMTAEASEAARRNAPGTPPAPPKIEPMYIKVRGDRGELIEIPNPKIATSLQTPASWPQQAAMALKAPFEMAADAAKYYSGVASRQYAKGFDFIPLRRDAWRGVDMTQYVPF